MRRNPHHVAGVHCPRREVAAVHDEIPENDRAAGIRIAEGHLAVGLVVLSEFPLLRQHEFAAGTRAQPAGERVGFLLVIDPVGFDFHELPAVRRVEHREGADPGQPLIQINRVFAGGIQIVRESDPVDLSLFRLERQRHLIVLQNPVRFGRLVLGGPDRDGDIPFGNLGNQPEVTGNRFADNQDHNAYGDENKRFFIEFHCLQPVQ